MPTDKHILTYKINIRGQVQGVGFRPHACQKALSFGLKGEVKNNEKGVEIILTTKKYIALKYLNEIISNPPPSSIIIDYSFEETKKKHFKDFKIISSEKGDDLHLFMTPDFAICIDCQNEITNSKNRRFFYPFTTCVNCGPRYSITNNFPFERQNTSVIQFKYCDECFREYSDFNNERRYHSQTNTCLQCGVQLSLISNKGKQVDCEQHKLIKTICLLLKQEKIIAIKNTSGFLLCCDASSASAIERLRKNKNRPKKPLAVLYPSLIKLQSDFKMSAEQQKILTSPVKPIIVLPLNDFSGHVDLESVTKGINQMGVMLPNSGLLHLIAQLFGGPLVATSGNINSSPIICKQNFAFQELSNYVDFFVDHNLEITFPQDDSVFKALLDNQNHIILRKARGLSPNFGFVESKNSNTILALGGQQKSNFSFWIKNYLFVSQYFGDLGNFDVQQRYTSQLKSFLHIFDKQPNIIIVDEHPNYVSTQIGKKMSEPSSVELLKIQHHVSHFTSVLGENKLIDSGQKVLGVVWDGAGWGTDGNIWGGEFFIYKNKSIHHIAQFEYFDWILGDKMSKDPKISLLSILKNCNLGFDFSTMFSSQELNIYSKILDDNTLKTSSIGRVFDAVSVLLNICSFNTYEGEAAMYLENEAAKHMSETPTNYFSNNFSYPITLNLIFKNILSDMRKGLSKGKIALNFIYSLASVIASTAKTHGCPTVALSGGVFQNVILIKFVKQLCNSFSNTKININLPANDENISHGQLIFYLNNLRYVFGDSRKGQEY